MRYYILHTSDSPELLAVAVSPYASHTIATLDIDIPDVQPLAFYPILTSEQIAFLNLLPRHIKTIKPDNTVPVPSTSFTRWKAKQLTRVVYL